MTRNDVALERAWEVLFEGLASSDGDVWRNVVYAALPRTGAQAEGRLHPLLDGHDDVLVAHTLEALASIEDPGAIRPAEQFLDSDDTAVRWAAIDYLGKCGDAASVRALVKRAESTPLGNLDCWRLAEALGDLKAPEGVPQLIRILDDPDHHTVATAAWALGRIGSSEGLSPLLQLLDSDADWEPRAQAIQAIGQIGDMRGVDSLLTIASNCHDGAEVRVGAAVALVRLEHDAAPPILLQFLDSSNDDLREWATAWCHWLAYAPATEKLIAFVEDRDELPDVRLRAIYALSQIGGKAAERALVTRVEDRKEPWRSYATGGLGDFRSSRAVATLITTLDDEQEDVRSAAVFSLGEIRDPAAIRPLLSSLDNDTAYHEVAVALAELGEQKAIPYLRAAVLGTGDWSTVEGLAKFGDGSIVPELAKRLDDSNQSARDRVFAATAIIRLASAAADPLVGNQV